MPGVFLEDKWGLLSGQAHTTDILSKGSWRYRRKMAHGEISESDVFLMSQIRLWWLFVLLLIKIYSSLCNGSFHPIVNLLQKSSVNYKHWLIYQRVFFHEGERAVWGERKHSFVCQCFAVGISHSSLSVHGICCQMNSCLSSCTLESKLPLSSISSLLGWGKKNLSKTGRVQCFPAEGLVAMNNLENCCKLLANMALKRTSYANLNHLYG